MSISEFWVRVVSVRFGRAGSFKLDRHLSVNGQSTTSGPDLDLTRGPSFDFIIIIINYMFSLFV